MLKEFINAFRPHLPTQALARSGPCRVVQLRRPHPTQLYLTQLDIGKESAIEEQGTPNPGPESEHHDRPNNTLSRPERRLGNPRRIGVVDYVHLPSRRLLKGFDRIDSDPRLVDVVRGSDPSIPDNGWKTDPDSAGGFQFIDKPCRGPCNGLRCCGHWSFYANSVPYYGPSIQVDPAGLHEGAANVDSYLDPRHDGEPRESPSR